MGNIKLGNNNISKIYRGTKEVTLVNKGSYLDNAYIGGTPITNSVDAEAKLDNYIINTWGEYASEVFSSFDSEQSTYFSFAIRRVSDTAVILWVRIYKNTGNLSILYDIK